MTNESWKNPWKLTAIGMALVIATVLVTSLVVANWSGTESDKKAVDVSPGPPAPHVGTSLVWAAEPASPPPAAKSAVSRAGARTSHVREVQQALLAAGHDPGPIDGIMGPRTQSALRTYIAVPPPQIPSPADRALAPFRANERGEGQ